jgi:hypothetical protein
MQSPSKNAAVLLLYGAKVFLNFQHYHEAANPTQANYRETSEKINLGEKICERHSSVNTFMDTCEAQ